MEKEKLGEKMNNLVEAYSKGGLSIEEAINEFELLINEYSDLRKSENNPNVQILRRFLAESLERMELLRKLKNEYSTNLEENLVLKKQLGVIS